METKKTHNTPDIELSPELIRQYREALASISDMRLVILLLFNSFEEVMKSFAAWRLSCDVDELPEILKNSPSFLFQVTLIGDSAQELQRRIKEFSKLRNSVAHGFHRKEYEEKLQAFVKMVLKKPCPVSGAAKRNALLEAVYALALEVASYLNEMPPRVVFPFPMLSLELMS
jgi:hypothetical protein